MNSQPVAVIGAGIGGLVAAVLLAGRGVETVVLERSGVPGGKMREAEVDGARIDCGPTVFTMRWVFDDIFGAIGEQLDNHISLRKTELLARHAWGPGEQLDLFADPQRSADAIGIFAGAAEARRYLDFCDRARGVYQTLVSSFIRAPAPTVGSLIKHAGIRGLAGLARIAPFESLWYVLGEYFHDPRLRQLFGRYATYCGSSPFLAPATLMLVAHVEQDGVWLVEGGMHRIAVVLAALAAKRGAAIRYNTEVSEISLGAGRVRGIKLANGEMIETAAVIVNADTAAIADGCFGRDVAGVVTPLARAQRSLSAMTFAMRAKTGGFQLAHHNVFFSSDYAGEFASLRSERLASEPTVYVCAQDRDEVAPIPPAHEKLFCLVNAPPNGDAGAYSEAEIAACTAQVLGRLQRCGLALEPTAPAVVTTPVDFHRLYPGTGGALYGPASHGWTASFRRPGARTKMPGLYLAGGSTHPGPGVPMAALSGQLSAAALLADRASMRRSR